MVVKAKILIPELVARYGMPEGKNIVVRILVNTNAGEVFILEGKEQHIGLVSAITRIRDLDDLKKNPYIAEHLVGGKIDIDSDGIVVGGILGASSFELGSQIVHNQSTLLLAKTIIRAFISKMPVSGEITAITLKPAKAA